MMSVQHSAIPIMFLGYPQSSLVSSCAGCRGNKDDKKNEVNRTEQSLELELT